MTAVPEDLAFRLVFIGIFAAGLAISTYYRWLARKSGGVIPRHREGTLALILRAAMALPLLAVILLYAFLPRSLGWSAVALPTWMRWLGAASGVACLTLMWWVFRSIGANISETVLTKTGHKLVTVGPYRWVRHPLYAVALLEIFALSLIAGNWLMALMWLIVALIFRYVVIPIEEANLIAVFHAEYERYREATGALMPRF